LHQPEKIRRFPGKTLLFGLILGLNVAACADDKAVETTPLPPPPAPNANLSACHDGAGLKLELAGAIEGRFEWRGSELQCESMRRPDDAGARLRFVADVDGSALALIIAIPDLERGQTGTELASNLTLYVEGVALFFGTQGTDSCWADVDSQELLDDERYDISGEVYCIAPLSEINGSSSVTIVDLAFVSRLDWDMT